MSESTYDCLTLGGAKKVAAGEGSEVVVGKADILQHLDNKDRRREGGLDGDSNREKDSPLSSRK